MAAKARYYLLCGINGSISHLTILKTLAPARKTWPDSYKRMACVGYNLGFDFSLRKEENMEAERINSLSALLADLTTREAELRRYL